LPVAVLTGLSALLPLALALAAKQPEAAEGVAIQPDGRAQIREGVGLVGQGLLGQLDLGEADHRMRPLPVWPGQAELAGEGDELALVVVLATAGGVFDPAGMDGLVEHGLQGLARPFGQALAGDERSGLRRAADRSRAAALRRPSISVWAANQLAQAAPHAMAELLDADAAVQGAQRRVPREGDQRSE
jgi:hypothetical protein